ncbi:MAG: HAD-IIIA family hydrolase [Oligoflexia bacterium]|nr:HAD-IIIA family hydrolase [Oligoflexia bacterium]
MKMKAVFFDKDGVLNKDSGIIWPKLELPYKQVADVISNLRSQGFLIFIISNRTEMARGLATEEEVVKSLLDFKLQIIEQNKEAIIEKIYYCPHHPNATIETYRANCSCRKPHSDLLIKAKEEYNICLNKSFMVGDRVSDIIAGNSVGCKTIQIISNENLVEKLIESNISEEIINSYSSPHYKITHLTQIYEIIS